MPFKDYKQGDFKRLSDKLAVKGARNPDALAAYIERKRLGAYKWSRVMRDGRRDNQQK